MSWVDWASVNDDSDDEWATPPSLWRSFERAVDGFDLDSASGCEPTPIASVQYTREDDGLSSEWFGTVWCNPPFSNPSEWLEKAVEEHCTKDNTDRILMLLPARTNTNWFSNHIEYVDGILFFDSKIKFMRNGEQYSDGLPTPVMLLIFGKISDELISTCNEHGWFVNVDQQTLQLSDYTEK